MKLDNKTKLIISVSNNPTNFGVTIYNYIFSKLNLNYVYLPFKFEDDESVIRLIRSLDVVGCSVSSPLKSKMIKHVDSMDQITKDLNNLNTIKNNDGALHGYNTDYFGFKSLIENLNLTSALIYGNGAVAKTILKALIDSGVDKVYLTGRSPQNIKKFIDNNPVENFSGQEVDMLINATPSGKNDINDGVFEYLNFAKVVIDLNVTEKDTILIKESRKRNLEVYKGSEMSINQLKAQFQIYTEILPNDKVFQDGLQLYFKT